MPDPSGPLPLFAFAAASAAILAHLGLGVARESPAPSDIGGEASGVVAKIEWFVGALLLAATVVVIAARIGAGALKASWRRSGRR